MNKQRQRFAIGVTALVVILALIVYWLWPRDSLMQSRSVIENIRPQERRSEVIKRIDLYLDGVPFGSQVHQVTIGKLVKASGEVELHPENLPEEPMSWIEVVYNRPGTSEERWSKQGPNKFRFFIVPEGGRWRWAQDVAKAYPDSMEPGEYELRAYLVMKDSEGERDVYDYFADGKMLAVAPGQGGNAR